MKYFTRILLSSFLLLHLLTTHAQIISSGEGLNKNQKDQDIFQEGEYWFEQENYTAAYVEYEKLIEKYPNEAILNYRMGVCELFMSHKWAESLEHLLKVPYEKYQKSEYPFFLACSYHFNLKFDEAIEEFNKFNKGKYGTKDMKAEAKLYIKNCEVGKRLVANPVKVDILNIGKPINSEWSEYVPLISADEEMLVFTYRGERSLGGKQFIVGKKNANAGEYFEDIMHSYKKADGTWGEPELLDSNINTGGNDACVSFGLDGQSIQMFRSIPGDLGSLYATDIRGKKWTDPVLIPGDINSKAWEGSITIAPDGLTAYFASERTGGKGGRDIWKATLQVDGSWGNIQNAGDSINTELDDDAPFFHPSGQYLLICSRGHASMGGYDIFVCSKVNDSTWSKPKNIGYPINTPGEDIYYSLSADGTHGYYSSGKAGGYGMQDIYVVAPGLPGMPVKLVQLAGTITLDEIPVEADLQLVYADSNQPFALKHSNSISGKYLADLPFGENYKAIYKLGNFNPQVRDINGKDIGGFENKNIDIHFYSENWLAREKAKKDSLERLALTSNPIKKDTIDIKPYLNATAEGLEFRVQIGAYNLPNNFRYSSVKSMAKVEKIKLDDNITRFVMGKFDNYNSAKEFRDKVIAAGITDAFITGIYKGKRVYLVDLVVMGVFKK